MPSAREILAEADALMRRNRARAVNTEIPELTEAVTEMAPVPTPTLLADVPELTDAVEEIEIPSIAEMPEDKDEASWLHFDPDRRTVLPVPPQAIASETEPLPHPQPLPEPEAQSAEPLLAVAANADGTLAVSAEAQEAPVEALTVAAPPATDTWARWEALADEVRMQVLHRVDLFTEASMREQLSAQLQPIMDRASAEMVAKVNEHIGSMLRAHIAKEIEGEIEKRRKDHV